MPEGLFDQALFGAVIAMALIVSVIKFAQMTSPRRQHKQLPPIEQYLIVTQSKGMLLEAILFVFLAMAVYLRNDFTRQNPWHVVFAFTFLFTFFGYQFFFLKARRLMKRLGKIPQGFFSRLFNRPAPRVETTRERILRMGAESLAREREGKRVAQTKGTRAPTYETPHEPERLEVEVKVWIKHRNTYLTAVVYFLGEEDDIPEVKNATKSAIMINASTPLAALERLVIDEVHKKVPDIVVQKVDFTGESLTGEERSGGFIRLGE